MATVLSLLFPGWEFQKTLERETRQCQALVIWTDCDREGENIGFEIIHVCRAGKCRGSQASVLWDHTSGWLPCVGGARLSPFSKTLPAESVGSHWQWVLEQVTEPAGASAF